MGFALLGLLVVIAIRALAAAARGRQPPRVVPAGPPEQPVAFGQGRTWLAVAGHDPEPILAALALTEACPIGWSEGLASATRDGGVFVTPPLDGWMLVVSGALPAIEDLKWLALRLGRALGTEVQGFQTDGERQGWLAVYQGEVLRAFAWDGADRKLLETGEPTRADEGIDAPCEADVLHVAGAWSVDPSSLGVFPSAGLGWLGRWPRAAE